MYLRSTSVTFLRRQTVVLTFKSRALVSVLVSIRSLTQNRSETKRRRLAPSPGHRRTARLFFCFLIPISWGG